MPNIARGWHLLFDHASRLVACHQPDQMIFVLLLAPSRVPRSLTCEDRRHHTGALQRACTPHHVENDGLSLDDLARIVSIHTN